MRVWNPEDTPHFSRDEMACTCCGKADMDGDFMEKLQRMRDLLGRPMQITSGYRCSNHPKEAKKTQPGSHGAGLAADIKVNGGAERDRIMELAYSVGMKGKGVANGFVHVDDGHPYAHRPALWKY